MCLFFLPSGSRATAVRGQMAVHAAYCPQASQTRTRHTFWMARPLLVSWSFTNLASGGWGCEVSCGVHHLQRGKTTTGSALDGARGVTIWVPHDTIRISIQRSRYDTYLATYLSTVRCQRDPVSSMKTETPVIRSTAHNLLLQWMEYLLLQLPLVGGKHDFAQLFQVYIRLFPSTWSEKICVLIDPFQEQLCI